MNNKIEKNINNAINELSIDDLQSVSGGTSSDTMGGGPANVTAMCPKCNIPSTFRQASGGRAYCNKCGTMILL